MQIRGIVAEFNPFHNGHKYLIDSVKEENTGIVCVMSGNFVQRGEPAVISKFARAKAAVCCGADLVLELPLPYSISTAMFFANGAIDVLKSLSVVDTLCFGSECGEIEKLKSAAEILESDKMPELLKNELKTGVGFASARQSAAEQLADADSLSVLTSPNDNLAVEYIMAANRLKADFEFMAVKRTGVSHDSDKEINGICSASMLRRAINEKPELLKKCMPEASFEILKNEIEAGRTAEYSLLERAIVTHLRTVSPEYLKNVPDVSEGLENRIILAANKFNTISDIITAVKSKRYTHARIRRIILASYLGVTSNLRQRRVPYIRVLGMNEKGAEILSLAKKRSSLYIIGSLKDAEKLCPDTFAFTSLEVKAGDVYSMLLKNPTPGKTEYTNRFFRNF